VLNAKYLPSIDRELYALCFHGVFKDFWYCRSAGNGFEPTPTGILRRILENHIFESGT
jgi:hypothetical protein